MKVVAFSRSHKGTGASRRLRNLGKMPGIVYGAGTEPKLIELDHNALYHAINKEAFHSSILDLEISGVTEKVLLRDVQYHPFRRKVLHVDFQRVDEKKKITVRVPLHYMNQEGSPAVKLGGGVIMHVLNEIEASCLPSNLPEFIEVNLANLELNQSLHAQDVSLPAGVELTPHCEQENPVIVSATLPASVVSDNGSEPPEGNMTAT
ncbi:50S ribosomal protein L25/general stress protein Ctc [Candidatus Vallotia lariciata]|uniref:50S ribosomal protein L25/general stress protein Ctc n=1 Tax=Candidatus Vallotia laricis TaxID=2018052 RepID=UPI001D00F168|nr:50S ribosomal protein L25/general stress protein Ctc [Candidatus Vallotia lariciata]UDG83312.1 50S ribosomal protein L25 [Candidatus Vallotia lariciata]